MHIPAGTRGLLIFTALYVVASCLPAKANAERSRHQVTFTEVAQLAYREPDHTSHYGDHPAQFIESWYPVTEPAQAGVVLVHGGCWLNTFGVDHTRALATELSSLGFQVWSLEYRRLGDENADWPGSLSDVIAAFDHIHGAQNLPAIAVAGHSAGGHLALLAIEQSMLKPELMLGLAAITNLERYAQASGSCQQAAAQLINLAAESALTAELSLNVPLTSKLNRILLYATEDSIVDIEQASLGTTPKLAVEGAGHFDFIHPHTQAFNAWLNELWSMLHLDD